MNTFPLAMDKHIIFCIIGFVFFMFQFFRQGFKYQILSAFAIAATLLLYLNDSSAWRYCIGVLELILIILIFIIMSAEKKKAENSIAAAEGISAEADSSENAEISTEKTDETSDGDNANE